MGTCEACGEEHGQGYGRAALRGVRVGVHVCGIWRRVRTWRRQDMGDGGWGGMYTAVGGKGGRDKRNELDVSKSP